MDEIGRKTKAEQDPTKAIFLTGVYMHIYKKACQKISEAKTPEEVSKIYKDALKELNKIRRVYN